LPLRGPAVEAGIELDASASPAARPALVEAWDVWGTDQRLRELSWKLRGRPSPAVGALVPWAESSSPERDSLTVWRVDAGSESERLAQLRAVRREGKAWGLSLLLTSGAIVFVTSVAALAASQTLARATSLPHEPIWQLGLTGALIGQGGLLLGLAWLTLRLWRNSRRLNAQLDALTARARQSDLPLRRA
jgi:hypothetical protein